LTAVCLLTMHKSYDTSGNRLGMDIILDNDVLCSIESRSTNEIIL
jgi:hypothetical protein